MVLTNILKKCHARNISLYELEHSCGFGNGTIRRWDVSSPSIQKVKIVADFFGCTVDDLLSEEAEEA